MPRPNHHREWLDAIIDNGVNLSEWEKQFIESLHDLLDRGGSLSEKQAETLERIYATKTP